MWLCRISGIGASALFLSEHNACMQIMHISAARCTDLCYLCIFFFLWKAGRLTLKALLSETATVCSWREKTLVCWCNLLKRRKTLYSCCWMSPGRPQSERKPRTGGLRISPFVLFFFLCVCLFLKPRFFSFLWISLLSFFLPLSFPLFVQRKGS